MRMAWFKKVNGYWYFVERVGPPGARKERKHYIGNDAAVVKRLSSKKRQRIGMGLNANDAKRSKRTSKTEVRR